MIVITGQIFTDPETLPTLYARLKALCDPTRAEDGCLFYHMAMEDPEKGIILAAEAWRDTEALQVHLAQPGITKLLSDFADRFSNDVQIHEVSSSQKLSV